MPTCEKHYDCDCDHPMVSVEVPTLKYVDEAGKIHPLKTIAQESSALVPGSDRWNDAAEAYFRSKWMQSSDGIRYLDEWKHGRKDELCVHGRKKHVCNVEDKDYKCVACH